MATAAIILAAGKGTRMKSDLPKVLHRIGNAPLIAHAIAAVRQTDLARLIAIVGHEAEMVAKSVAEIYDDAFIVTQSDQLGTAHAVLQALPGLQGFKGQVLILYGDTPFIRCETLEAMLEAQASGNSVTVLGFDAASPGSYGRLIRDAKGTLARVVEAKDATAAELETTLCNSGVICVDAATLRKLVPRIGNTNAKGEFYLTDIIALARADGLQCGIVTCPETECLGVDSREALIKAEAIFQTRSRSDAIENGTTLLAPETVFFSQDTAIGGDVIVEPNVIFGLGVSVENGATIRAFSHLEGCHVSQGAIVGPFARLRPGAEIGPNAHVGNFVEIKNAVLDQGAKVNHLSYIGDAHIGEAANIGAGTITCNYDGVFKHRTEIGARAFIGSNSALVAPVKIGAETLIAAGSVITADVADGALAVARGQQTNKPGLARKLMDKLRSAQRK